MDRFALTLRKIRKFNLDRHWKNLALDDLAKSISIESAELLEHFQWDTSNKRKKDLEKISLEIADIFWYLATFCQESGIDLLKSVDHKLMILEDKYPKNAFGKSKIQDDVYLKLKQEYRKKHGR